MPSDLQTILQLVLSNLGGWFRFWFLPRLWSAAITLFIAHLLVRWLDSMWYSWLRPFLVSSRKRSTSQAVWRQARILSLPKTLTRVMLYLIAVWFIAERFGVPRDIILWSSAIVTVAVLWSVRHLISDMVASYSLILDDAIVEGDLVSSPFGEGTVERVTWFAVHLRANDGTKIIVPCRAMKSNAVKVRCPSSGQS